MNTPIDMVLHCPKCGLQHIDGPDERTPNWKNEPHRSHLCHGCGHIWRPADVPTNGVAAVKTRGQHDSEFPATPPDVARDAVPECFRRLLIHSSGLCLGTDWNKGTAATYHRKPLFDAVRDCEALLAAQSAKGGEA